MTRFTLNGAEVALDLPDHATLLQALRGPLGLSSPRFGCGAEQCGSCMVLLDGKPAYACALGLHAVAGRKVVTVEGLGSAASPHPLQKAFVAMNPKPANNAAVLINLGVVLIMFCSFRLVS